MERESHDINSSKLTSNQINEMEERRLQELKDAGIDEEEVLHKSKENQNVWGSYFNENITRGKDDINFALRDQWTAVERSEFTRLFKPCFTFNKIYDAPRKIMAEQRKNRPDTIVRSLNGKAPQEQITLRADMLRTLGYLSQVDLVYQHAFKCALLGGYGAFQVILDYEKNRSFNKIGRYDLIPDPTLCSWDPTAIKPHKGDGNVCSRKSILTRDQFFATYPYILNPVSYTDSYLLLDTQRLTRDNIVICDEFVKEWYPLNIYKLSNGMVVDEDEWKEAQETYHLQKEITEGSIVAKIIKNGMPKIVAERQTQDYHIMHYRMIKDRIIDFSKWPSSQLPIPFVAGDSFWIEGREYTKSFIHDARDTQKSLNYIGSESMAEIKNRRREQWLGTPDNIKGYEQQWRNPETQLGMLVANPDPKTGAMPIKQPAWEISRGLLETFQRCNQDLREILGFSEQEILQSRDISGKARRERKMEGSMSAYVYIDNLHQAIAQGGRIMNDLLTYIVGEEERNFVLIKSDGKSQSIILNHMQKDGTIKNQLLPGDYDVEIDTGPSFAVQKEVALEMFTQTIQAYPQAFPLIADLWAGNLDIEQMPMIKERFKTLVPPQILAKEEGKELPPQPPSPQEQMMKMQQVMMMQEMKNKEAQLQERAEELRLRKMKHDLEEAELVLEAKKMQANIVMKNREHHADMTKADLDYSAKIASILADTHHKNLDRESKVHERKNSN